MKFEMVPKVCQGEAPAWKGKIVINVPRATERHNYIRQSGVLALYEKKAAGKAEEEISFDLSSQYELITSMMGFVEKHVEKVDLVRVEDGYKVDSVDAFLSIGSLESAVMEICLMFIKGFEPGKNSAT